MSGSLRQLEAHLLGRRYGVPGRMIEEATRHRLAGDWRAACAAAGITVDPSLNGPVPEAVADDLRHLVPDLVRWHLPRAVDERGRFAAVGTVDLAVYPHASPGRELALMVHLPRPDRRQTLLLALRDRLAQTLPHGLSLPHRLARAQWDSRRTDDLRLRCGDSTRTAFFHPDGVPLTVDELPRERPAGRHRAQTLEWATMRWERGDFRAALDIHGIDVEEPDELWAAELMAPDLLSRAVHGFAAEAGQTFTQLRLMERQDGRNRMHVHVMVGRPVLSRRPRRYASERSVGLPGDRWQRTVDADLVRSRMLTVGELHPLVRRSLFPAAPDSPPFTWLPGVAQPIRVPCGGGRHEVNVIGEAVRSAHHPADELAREAVLSALGTVARGCGAVRVAWAGGRGQTGPEVDDLLHLAIDLMVNGNPDGLLAVLDAGYDPRRCDAHGTLLHRVHYVDRPGLVERLLAAGVDPRATDAEGRTAAQVARDAGADAVACALEAHQ